jgi:cytochrome c553
MQRVPDSKEEFPGKLMSDPYFTPDWHPDDHPPMPEIVFRGRKPTVRACGSCHRAEGTGGPENANLAGLPEAYIVQQMADFKSGARKSAGPPRNTIRNMIAAAETVSDEDVQAAARYFSSLQPRKLISVVEAEEIPKVYISGMHFAVDPAGGSEPLGRRIIEVPRNLRDFDNNDSRATFIAYAPVGSIAMGEALVKTGGNGRTVPCGTCHGPMLKGVDATPGLAGRSPSYLARQLYDFKHGARSGASSLLMQPIVAMLEEEDMIALAAYIASLPP